MGVPKPRHLSVRTAQLHEDTMHWSENLGSQENALHRCSVDIQGERCGDLAEVPSLWLRAGSERASSEDKTCNGVRSAAGALVGLGRGSCRGR